MLIRLPRPKSMITWRFYFWYFRDRYCSLYSPQLCWGLNGRSVIRKASELLSLGATVGAICGATVALANFGLLDNRRHTSNGQGFLEMFSPAYKGQDLYVDKPSVADNNLITANPAGALLWSKQIIEHLGVCQADTLEFWYQYFSTGKAESFFALMQTVAPNTEK